MIRIAVTVRPQSKRAELRKIAEGEYAAWVAAPAREGRANAALIELLADYFSVPKSRVRIVRGEAGRKKLVEIG